MSFTLLGEYDWTYVKKDSEAPSREMAQWVQFFSIIIGGKNTSSTQNMVYHTYFIVCVRVYVRVDSCGGQRTTWGSWLFPSPVWVPGIKLSGLAASFCPLSSLAGPVEVIASQATKHIPQCFQMICVSTLLCPLKACCGLFY